MPLGPPGGKGGYSTDLKLIPPKEKTDPDKYASMKQREANGKNPCLKYIILGKCDFGDKCNRCHEASNWNFSAADKEVAKRELERGRKNSEIYRKIKKAKGDGKGGGKAKWGSNDKTDKGKGKGDGKGKDKGKKSDKPCLLYAKGSCTRGDACWYKHE